VVDVDRILAEQGQHPAPRRTDPRFIRCVGLAIRRNLGRKYAICNDTGLPALRQHRDHVLPAHRHVGPVLD
jgi:hypothetical protein